MSEFFVDPYIKYYNNLQQASSLSSTVNSIGSAIADVAANVSSLSSQIDASRWKELGQEAISTSVLPTISARVTSIKDDVTNVLQQAVTKAVELYDKVSELKTTDEQYETAKKELESLKNSEPSYSSGDDKGESSEHKSWEDKVKDKEKEVDKLKDKCKSLQSESDSIASSINSLTISDEPAEVVVAAPNSSVDLTSLSDLLGSAAQGIADKVLSSVTIPDNIKQAGYTVTGYDYWIKTGKKMVWASGTNQRKVSEIWQQQGSRFKNGIAVVNVNGQDRYLIAVAKTFGKVGDSVTVNLANGTKVPCIIADQKSSHDPNYTQYGHGRSSGSVNVLEFEVQRSTFKQNGNPTTSKWGLDWDSSSKVRSIDNNGTIL